MGLLLLLSLLLFFGYIFLFYFFCFEFFVVIFFLTFLKFEFPARVTKINWTIEIGWPMFLWFDTYDAGAYINTLLLYCIGLFHDVELNCFYFHFIFFCWFLCLSLSFSVELLLFASRWVYRWTVGRGKIQIKNNISSCDSLLFQRMFQWFSSFVWLLGAEIRSPRSLYTRKKWKKLH